MDYLNELITQIELHSVEGIRDCFDHGVDPNQLFRNEPLIYELTSEYARTPGFKDCVRAFVDYGLQFEDKILLSVLLDDAARLQELIGNNSGVVKKKYSLRCAYTPLQEASLLHICAEFNHISCARLLVAHEADINDTAGLDEYGFGGQHLFFTL